MKRLIHASVLALLSTLGSLCATAQMTVSGSHVQDSTGTPLASATITFTPVNNSGLRLSYKASSGGQTVGSPVSATVTNGVFSISLPDTHLTNPQNVCFSVSVEDNVSGTDLPFSGHTCIQPSTDSSQTYWCTTSSTCNFDLYTPSNGTLTVQTSGPTGATGRSATVIVGTTTNPTYGTPAAVTNTGTSADAVLNFAVPQGPKGDTGTAGANGQDATVGDLSGNYVAAAVTGTQDGTNKAFTVAQGGYWRVLLNGVELLSNIDYTQTGTTLTFPFAPSATDRITVEAFTVLSGSAATYVITGGINNVTVNASGGSGTDTVSMSNGSSSVNLQLLLDGGLYSGIVFGPSSHRGSILIAPDGIGFYDSGTELQKASSSGYRINVPLNVHYPGSPHGGDLCASSIVFCVDDSLFTVDQSGNVLVSGLAGSGNGFACVNAAGQLYRSPTACN